MHNRLTRAEFSDEVVRIVSLHHLQQLQDVGMVDHLQQLCLTTKVFVHIQILLGFLLVNYLDCNLQAIVIRLADNTCPDQIELPFLPPERGSLP